MIIDHNITLRCKSDKGHDANSKKNEINDRE